MNGKSQAPGRLTLLAFFATVLIGGTNFVAVKVSNAELPPLFGAGLRFSAGAVIMLAVMLVRRLPVPRGGALLGAALYGTLSFATVYGLLYFALVHINAGTASVIMASVPLATLALAVAHKQERFTSRRIAGGVLAVGGISVISLGSLGGGVALIPVLAAVGGMLAASEGTVLVKAFPKINPVSLNAVGMSVGSGVLLLASAASGESWSLPSAGRTLTAFAWLVLAGSVGLFGLLVYVIRSWTASASVYALTLMPLVSVGLGAFILGEAVTAGTLAGGVLVILGVWLGAFSRPLQRRSASARPAEAV